MSKDGIVLMTALPPSVGHMYLINFSLEFIKSFGGGKVRVVLSAIPGEPYSGVDRLRDLQAHFKNEIDNHRLEIILIEKDLTRQQMLDMSVWRDILARTLPQRNSGDFLFASDRYGIELSKSLDCEFIPCNVYREIIDISATRIRQDPIKYFATILPETQDHFRRTVTFFGCESVGKTTMSKHLASEMNAYWVPEWAREYLEIIGSEVTEEKMERIAYAQAASQNVVNEMKDKPWIFRDTDLLSTIGYNLLWSKKCPTETRKLFKPANLYIVMNDQIKFTPDQLRYGGNKRETASSFWIDLLREYDCKYHVVEATDMEEQAIEIEEVIRADFMEHANLATHVRRDAPVVAKQ